MILVYTLAVALTILQFADGWTTYKVTRFSAGREDNPVVRWLMEKLGAYTALVLLKAVSIALVWVIVFWPTAIEFRTAALFALACVYAMAAASNYEVLKRLKQTTTGKGTP